MAVASAVITVHRQGRILTPTLRSIIAAKHHAKNRGHEVEIVVVADKIDDVTKFVLNAFSSEIEQYHDVSFGDPGASRRHGIHRSSHEWIFFHDADDLYSENWFTAFMDMTLNENFIEKAVYHGEIMVGFGISKYYRRQASSADYYFEPMALTTQWYFATNLFVHKNICEQFPIPSHDRKTGVGHDDWAWSCNTLAAGIPRLLCSDTVSFYREKPANVGVGKVPGIIHPASPLFDPEYVRNDTQSRASRKHGPNAYSFGNAHDARDLSMEGRIAPWIIQELRKQAVFEPELTDLLDEVDVPAVYQVNPVRTSLAQGYRYLCEFLDERPKIIISINDEHIPGADHLVEGLISQFSIQYSEYQVIVFIQGQVYPWRQNIFFEKYGALVINTTKFEIDYGIEFWFRNRFYMRFYVQFKIIKVIDFGTDFFQSIYDEFFRPINHFCKDVLLVYARQHIDICSPALRNILKCVDKTLDGGLECLSVHSFASEFTNLVLKTRAIKISSHPQAAVDAWIMFCMRRYAASEITRTSLLESARLDHIIHARQPITSNRVAKIDFDDRRNGVTARDKVLVLKTVDCFLPESLIAFGERIFSSDEWIDILVPQVLFWKSASAEQHFTWVDGADLVNNLKSLVELANNNEIKVPFFVMFRNSGRTRLLYNRLRVFHQTQFVVPLIREIVTASESHNVASLANSIAYTP